MQRFARSRCFLSLSFLLSIACTNADNPPHNGSSDASTRDGRTSDGSTSDASTSNPPDASWWTDASEPEDAAIWLDAGPDAAIEEDAAVPEPDPDPDPQNPNPTSVKVNYRVLHWNIAGGKENGCQTGGITRAVVRHVREKKVDFVGLNEVCPSQYKSIHDALRKLWGKGNAKFSAYIGDKTNRIVGNAIYSRFNLDQVTKDKVGNDQYGDRNLLCGQLKKYPHLRFCSTHLTPGDATARLQMGRVRKRIEGWWDNRKDTVILSGDLNIHPNDQGLNNIYSAAANHPKNNPNNNGNYREVDDNDPDHCRGYGERSLPGTSGGPCQAGGKIDFIFVRQNRIIDGNYNGDTFNDPGDCSGRCSDHRAVFGRIQVRIRL